MEISKFLEILREVSVYKQCVPGSFSPSHAREPENKANMQVIAHKKNTYSSESFQYLVCLHDTKQQTVTSLRGHSME